MKIALVGPTYPFRGGISHYTTLLLTHLREKHQTQFYAFTRPYPRLLFPGDPSHDSSEMQLADIEAIPSVDWANPFSWFKTGLLIAEWSPDMVIFPWWMWGWAIPFYAIGKVVSIRAKAKILYICHNVIEHETAFWKSALSQLGLSIGDYFIVHSQQDYANLRRMFPEAKIRVNFHPTYEVFRHKLVSKENARKKLGIDGEFKKVLLFFGIVRPYKGLSYLIQAMPRIIAQMPNLCLLVAGEFWEKEENYLRQIKQLHVEDAVKVINEYIPNEEVGLYFSAADIVVLPYVSGTGSGIVQIAFGFNKPVIATRVGCLPAVVSDKETGYLIEPKNSRAIVDAVISFYNEGEQDVLVDNVARNKEKFSWDRMVEVIDAFE